MAGPFTSQKTCLIILNSAIITFLMGIGALLLGSAALQMTATPGAQGQLLRVPPAFLIAIGFLAMVITALPFMAIITLLGVEDREQMMGSRIAHLESGELFIQESFRDGRTFIEVKMSTILEEKRRGHRELPPFGGISPIRKVLWPLMRFGDLSKLNPHCVGIPIEEDGENMVIREAEDLFYRLDWEGPCLSSTLGTLESPLQCSNLCVFIVLGVLLTLASSEGIVL